MVEEFRQAPERLETLHKVPMIPAEYPQQEYSSYLVSHLYREIYTKEHPSRIEQLIDQLFEATETTLLSLIV